MHELTEKQRSIYEFIMSFTASQGFPPSVREIGEAVGLKSPSSVHAHIKSLEEFGYITKDGRKTRALSTMTGSGMYGKVPVVGRVRAGMPVLAVEEIESYVPFDSAGMSGSFFALRVEGDSMIEAGINDGDIVIIREQETAYQGEIVVALIDEEATVKRLRLDKGHIWLMPENPAYDPINGDDCRILGVVKALYRIY
jgi:repressor LexA